MGPPRLTISIVTLFPSLFDSWLRQAVLRADNDDALWAWVQSPSGAADLHAWKRLLSRLDFHDPRRSLASARIGSLRAASTDNRLVPARESG